MRKAIHYSRHVGISISVPRIEPLELQFSAIGIDIQSIKEIGASLEQFGNRFTSRLFTRREIDAWCGSTSETPRYFAEAFAAKEAVLKILVVRESVPPWKSIELLRSRGGPSIGLHGSTAELARQQFINMIQVSISHDGDTVIAVAVSTRAPNARS